MSSFTPHLCSTPKFVPVLHQPSHFVITAPIRISNEKSTAPSNNVNPSRRLKKRQRYSSKQFNASTAINRQYYFPNETMGKDSKELFFCLSWWNLFHRSKRRRHGPCHV